MKKHEYPKAGPTPAQVDEALEGPAVTAARLELARRAMGGALLAPTTTYDRMNMSGGEPTNMGASYEDLLAARERMKHPIFVVTCGEREREVGDEALEKALAELSPSSYQLPAQVQTAHAWEVDKRVTAVVEAFITRAGGRQPDGKVPLDMRRAAACVFKFGDPITCEFPTRDHYDSPLNIMGMVDAMGVGWNVVMPLPERAALRGALGMHEPRAPGWLKPGASAFDHIVGRQVLVLVVDKKAGVVVSQYGGLHRTDAIGQFLACHVETSLAHGQPVMGLPCAYCGRAFGRDERPPSTGVCSACIGVRSGKQATFALGVLDALKTKNHHWVANATAYKCDDGGGFAVRIDHGDVQRFPTADDAASFAARACCDTTADEYTFGGERFIAREDESLIGVEVEHNHLAGVSRLSLRIVSAPVSKVMRMRGVLGLGKTATLHLPNWPICEAYVHSSDFSMHGANASVSVELEVRHPKGKDCPLPEAMATQEIMAHAARSIETAVLGKFWDAGLISLARGGDLQKFTELCDLHDGLMTRPIPPEARDRIMRERTEEPRHMAGVMPTRKMALLKLPFEPIAERAEQVAARLAKKERWEAFGAFLRALEDAAPVAAAWAQGGIVLPDMTIVKPGEVWDRHDGSVRVFGGGLYEEGPAIDGLSLKDGLKMSVLATRWMDGYTRASAEKAARAPRNKVEIRHAQAETTIADHARLHPLFVDARRAALAMACERLMSSRYDVEYLADLVRYEEVRGIGDEPSAEAVALIPSLIVREEEIDVYERARRGPAHRLQRPKANRGDVEVTMRLEGRAEPVEVIDVGTIQAQPARGAERATHTDKAPPSRDFLRSYWLNLREGMDVYVQGDARRDPAGARERQVGLAAWLEWHQTHPPKDARALPLALDAFRMLMGLHAVGIGLTPGSMGYSDPEVAGLAAYRRARGL